MRIEEGATCPEFVQRRMILHLLSVSCESVNNVGPIWFNEMNHREVTLIKENGLAFNLRHQFRRRNWWDKEVRVEGVQV